MVEYDEHDHEQEFAPALVRRIAQRVADGVAATRDTTIEAPRPGTYVNGNIVVDDEPRSLMLDVTVDSMRLRLHADHRHFGSAPRDGGEELAAMIVSRVAEFSRDRRSHANRLGRFRQGIEDKLVRDGAVISLVGVTPMAMPIEESIAGCSLMMTARIEMLDATLTPFSHWIHAWSPREAAGLLNEFAPSQRRRKRTRERLDASGAVLEIDAVAERAIAAAGESVGEVADLLMRIHRRDECDYPHQIPASGGDVETMVMLEDGCIVAQLEIPGKVVIRGATLQLHHAIPETTALAAVGRPATDIVDLPALSGLATIISQKVIDERQRTYFNMKIPRRPLLAQELGK